MNLIFSRYSKFPPFLMFPKFLDEIEDLTDTDKRVYIEIFNRMRISLQNENWIDRNGNVFVVYKIDQLTKQLHKSSSTIKASLSKLEEKDLILRKHRGVGRPNYIYIKVPKEIKRPKNCPPQSQNSDFHMDDILNLKINNRNMINNERIHINADDSIPPTLDQIIEYNKAKGLDIDCEAFYYYYSANGWTQGRTPIKNWKAAMHSWALKAKYFDRSNDQEDVCCNDDWISKCRRNIPTIEEDD